MVKFLFFKLGQNEKNLHALYSLWNSTNTGGKQNRTNRSHFFLIVAATISKNSTVKNGFFQFSQIVRFHTYFLATPSCSMIYILLIFIVHLFPCTFLLSYFLSSPRWIWMHAVSPDASTYLSLAGKTSNSYLLLFF
jgi:hypothetical protein